MTLNRSIGRCVIAAAAIWLTACETTVEVEMPTHPDLLMMNSFFYADYEFEIWLGEAVSLAVGEDAIGCVSDGTVELWQGTRRLETLPHVGDCLYRSPDSRPEPGIEYTIRASAPGYDPIQATDAAPLPVESQFAYEVVPGNAENGRIDVSITFTDPPDVDSWYRIMVLYRISDENGSWYYDPGFVTDYEPIVVDNGILFESGNDRYDTVFFTDARIPRGKQTIELDVARWFDGAVGDIDLVIYFDVLSKHFYDYATTFRLQRDVGDNPFAEPVQISTNVESRLRNLRGIRQERAGCAGAVDPNCPASP